MRKVIFLMLVFAGMLQPVFAQTDTIPYKLGTYFRTAGFLFNANLSVVWMKNMRQFLKSEDLADDFSFSSSLPFDVGVRVKDYFFTVNMAIPAFWDSRSNSELITGSLLIERSFFKTRNYRFNAGLGLSIYEHRFSITQDEPNLQVSLDDLLNTRFKSTPIIFNRGGAVDVYVSLANREKKKISIENCFRLGYRHGLKPYRWRSDSFKLTQAPIDQLNMVYFQYLISLSRNQ